MNRWVRLGLAILVLAILARVGLAIFALGLKLVQMMFPLVVLIGAGFVVYGLYRHWRRRAALQKQEYYDRLED